MNYYVSNLGDDNNSGLTEEQPWKTISKVNSFKFKPNDIINFKCGDVWREQLKPCSGDVNGTIKYTSYGLGNKPLILGSISKTNESDWIKESGYIWKTSASIDVGNIIFNGNIVGFKKFNKSNFTYQNDFWYDSTNNLLYIYSTHNPAILYKSIELALTRNIIEQSNVSYVEYSNLELKYGGGHGIGGDTINHIHISNCDISYVGGGKHPTMNVRYGNGIELWNNASNILVEGCAIHDIYDAGITNQGIGDNIIQRNITFRNNKIWNCTYSIEIWLRKENSLMENIIYESNTCIYAGNSSRKNQRDYNLGRHVCLYDSTSKINDLKIINNVFINATESTIYRASVYNEFEHVTIENNYITQHSAIIRDNYNLYNISKFEAGKTTLDNTIGTLIK